MVTSPRICQRNEGRTCKLFLSVIDEDLPKLYTVCHGQLCCIELTRTLKIGQLSIRRKCNLILTS